MFALQKNAGKYLAGPSAWKKEGFCEKGFLGGTIHEGKEGGDVLVTEGAENPAPSIWELRWLEGIRPTNLKKGGRRGTSPRKGEVLVLIRKKDEASEKSAFYHKSMKGRHRSFLTYKAVCHFWMEQKKSVRFE